MLWWIIKLLKSALKNLSLPEAKGCGCLVMFSLGHVRVEYMYFIFLCHVVLCSLIAAQEVFKNSLPCLGVLMASSGCLISCVF